MEFAIGVLIGLVGGLLFAPKAGKEMVKDLENIPDMARETAEDVRGRIDEAIKAGKEAAVKKEQELKEEISEEEKETPPGYIV